MTYVLLAWLLFCAWQTHQYVKVWRSDLALWSYAVTQAPLKPRPASSLAATLVVLRHPDARFWLDRAEALAELPHVPPLDRSMTRRAVSLNRLLAR